MIGYYNQTLELTLESETIPFILPLWGGYGHAQPPYAQVQWRTVFFLEGKLCRKVHLHRSSERSIWAKDVELLIKLYPFGRQVQASGHIVS